MRLTVDCYRRLHVTEDRAVIGRPNILGRDDRTLIARLGIDLGEFLARWPFGRKADGLGVCFHFFFV